ncbi:MAG: TrkA-C domain protein [Actinomycetia bacterium]|nr:TrkA-C domain protein [Actinomycetes bacterium]
MVGVATLLVLLLVGLLVTRVATVALRATGLAHEAAYFQARSAFSGVGFTTAESEDIVNHPTRRRIVLTLMLLSGAGVVTTLASLVLSFAGTHGYREPALRLGILVVGLAALWAMAANDWFDRWLSRVIERALARWTDLDVRDYVRLLHIDGTYSIAEIGIGGGDWLEGRRIEDLHLAREGVVVLGIRQPDGTYLGAPMRATAMARGDTVIVYGRVATLDELQGRLAGVEGDRAHARSVAEHDRHHVPLEVHQGGSLT